MASVLNVLKVLLVAALIIALGQVRVGSGTVESHAEEFLRKSWLSNQIRWVAQGGATLISNTWHSASQIVKSNFSENGNGVTHQGARR
ncbi:MAG: hypothetical protein N2578_00345 [Bdellovibrionaceae bacterium]|nr:hypothetical protein [Pseudobdellovibrionaceae bacterium]